VADRFVRASEIGEYEFCARAWWLGRVLGREHENPHQLDAGRRDHAGHGRGVNLAGVLQQAGLILVLTALVVVVLLVLLGGGR
jgi:hypothetical protein